MDSSKPKTKKLNISGVVDVAYVALDAKNFAKKIGFSRVDQFMISTAVSELAQNIVTHANAGIIHLKPLNDESKNGIEVVAEDSGPGIQDIEKAMTDNFSTSGTMGVGLPGTRRLMDYFHISSQLNQGTKVTIRKWI